MKIAVIGGGAAGVMTAYHLASEHQVILLEKAPSLGGHIQTLNKNVPSQLSQAHESCSENGVVGFHYFASREFRKLIKQLKIPYRVTWRETASGLYFKNNQRLFTPTVTHYQRHGLLQCIKEVMSLCHHLPKLSQFYLKLLFLSKNKLASSTFGQLLPEPESRVAQWLRCMIMLGYSIPYQATLDFPMRLAKRLFKDYLLFPIWWVIPGGVYTYIEKILAIYPQAIQVHCNVEVQSVVRQAEDVIIHCPQGKIIHADKVVFALPPDTILPLLAIPTELEKTLFSQWSSRVFKTTAHVDETIYQTYDAVTPSVCDYFKDGQGRYYYNTYLNDYYQLGQGKWYQFGNLPEHVIKPQAVVHQCTHIVPEYSNDALDTQQAIMAISGQNHTFYAGAYLYDGLHEGAARSALNIKKQLKAQQDLLVSGGH